MANAKLLDTDMSRWGPGVKHYACDDGTFFAVMVDEANGGMVNVLNTAFQELPSFTDIDNTSMFILPRETTICPCDAEGHPTAADDALGLVAHHTFPPRTTHDDALRQAGHTVT